MLMGFIFGIMVGSYFSLKWAVAVGIKLMKEKKIDIEFDEDIIASGILQYQNQFERLINLTGD